MKDLITRLESAEGGSRELSDEVLKACDWNHSIDQRLPDRSQWGWLTPAGWFGNQAPTLILDDPSPTKSLDAALKLVPAGWRWHRYKHLPGAREGRRHHVIVIGGGYCDSNAATPSLALCIAALKAREGEAS